VKDVIATDSGVAVIADSTWAAFEDVRRSPSSGRGSWAGQTSEAIWKAFEARSSEAGTVNKQTGDPSPHSKAPEAD